MLLYALHVWYENRGFRARFIRIISFVLFHYFNVHLFSVKDISGNTLPTNFNFCTRDKHCIVKNKIRAIGLSPLELFPFIVLAIKLCIFLIISIPVSRFYWNLFYSHTFRHYKCDMKIGTSRFIRVISLCHLAVCYHWWPWPGVLVSICSLDGLVSYLCRWINLYIFTRLLMWYPVYAS